MMPQDQKLKNYLAFQTTKLAQNKLNTNVLKKKFY